MLWHLNFFLRDVDVTLKYEWTPSKVNCPWLEKKNGYIHIWDIYIYIYYKLKSYHFLGNLIVQYGVRVLFDEMLYISIFSNYYVQKRLICFSNLFNSGVNPKMVIHEEDVRLHDIFSPNFTSLSF